jgi:hypothetical protein
VKNLNCPDKFREFEESLESSKEPSSEVAVLTESVSQATEEDTLLTDHHLESRLGKTEHVVDEDPATGKYAVEEQRRSGRQKSQISSSVDKSSHELQPRYRENFQSRQSTSVSSYRFVYHLINVETFEEPKL